MSQYENLTALERAQITLDMHQPHYNKRLPAQPVHGAVDSLLLAELAHLEALDPVAELHFTVDSAASFMLQAPASDGINYPSLNDALSGALEDYVLVDYWVDPLQAGLILRFLPRHDEILREQVLHHVERLSAQEKAILTPEDYPDDEDAWFDEHYGHPTEEEANCLAARLIGMYATDILVDGTYQLYLERGPGAGEMVTRYRWEKDGDSKLRLRFIEIETDQKACKTTYQQDAMIMVQTTYA